MTEKVFGFWNVVEPKESEAPLSAECSFDCQQCSKMPKGLKGDLMASPNLPSLINETSGRQSSSSSVDVTDVLIMLPGNPGVVDWYNDMMQAILKQSEGKVAVLVCGFLGHHSGRVASEHKGGLLGGSTGVACLQEQIESLDTLLTNVVLPSFSRDQKIKVHIGGHSIGAFVAAHLAARHPNSIQGKCFLLAPTVCNMLPSPNGQMNNKFLNFPLITLAAGLAAVATRLVPTSFLKPAIKNLEKTPMADEHLDIALGMAKSTPGILQSMLWMARSEFDQLTSIDPHLLSMIGPERTVAYFAQHDGWVPQSDIALFRQNCSEGSTIILEENPAVPHAFVLGFNEIVVQNAIAPFIEAMQ